MSSNTRVADSARFAPASTGVRPIEEVLREDGLVLFRRMLAGEIPAPPMAAVMNMSVTRAEHGSVTFSSVPDAKLLNPMGSIHGGYALTLLDSCMACAVHSTLKAGQAYTSVEVKVNFVRPITPNMGVLNAVGTVLNAGRRIATSEGKIVGDNGKLYAHGTTTCLIFPAGS